MAQPTIYTDCHYFQGGETEVVFVHRPVDYTVRSLSRRALAPLLAVWLVAAPAALAEPPAPGARLDALIGKLQARESELSLPEAREGLGLARQLKNPRAELDFQQVLIQNALQTGEYQQVVQQGEEAIRLGKKIGADASVTQLIIIMGSAHFHLSHNEKALSLYQEALARSEALKDPGTVLQCLGNIGNVFWTLQNIDRALEYYRRALDLAQAQEHTVGMAGLALNIGLLNTEKGDYQTALVYYRQALAHFQQAGLKAGIAMALHNIGEALSHLDPADPEALDTLKRALILREALDDQRGLIATLGAIGEIYLIQKAGERALPYFLRASDIAVKIGEKYELARVHKSLTENYVLLGDHRRALESHRQYAKIWLDNLSEENSRQIAEMNVRFETERKEREIAMLQRDRQISTLELKNQKSIQQLLGVVIVLGLALLGLTYSRYRLKVRKNRELEEAIRTDPLTGIANRRAVTECLHREKARGDRQRHNFAIILLDIDDFKKINDTHGHDAGDKVLVQVANTLARSTRAQDMAGRWGGEEFLLVLPETNLDGGVVVADKIRQQVSRQCVDFNDGQIRVTLSLGVSVVTPDRSLDAVLSAADEAMYLAKRSGKDCVAEEGSPGIFRLANRTLSSDGSSLRPVPC